MENQSNQTGKGVPLITKEEEKKNQDPKNLAKSADGVSASQETQSY